MKQGSPSLRESAARHIFPHTLHQPLFAGHGEDTSEPNQLVPMQPSEAIDGPLTSARQMNLDLASVGASRVALDQPKFLATRHKRHDAMVLGLQSLGQFRNRGPFALREPLNLEQQKVLQVGNAFPEGQLFAEVQKAAQLISKIRQRLELCLAQRRIIHWIIWG